MKQRLNAKIFIIFLLLTLRNWLNSFTKFVLMCKYVKVKMCWIMHQDYGLINTLKYVMGTSFPKLMNIT